MIDLLIKNTTIITVDKARRIYECGSIAIHEGKIIAVGQANEINPVYSARRVIDGKGKITLPGLTNLHFHLPQVMMRGVYDSIEAMEKLKYYTWPIQGCYDEDDALVSAQLGVLEMIKSGTTAFLSTGLHPRYGIDRIVGMIADSGIRAGVSKYVMDTHAYDLDNSALHKGMWENGKDSLDQAIDLIEKWNGAAGGRIRAWISPRSIGGCSVDLMKKVVQIAKESNVGITAHWSEAQSNVDYTLKNFNLRPVNFAREIGLVGPNVVFAHGIYLDEEEIEILAETGTSVAHCPVCNSKLAMGVAKVPQMLKAGVNVALGNDGMGVNNTADIFREMRDMLLLHRATQGNALYPSTGEAIEMATLHGARALMEGERIGSLEVGKRADVILVNARQPHLVPLHDAASAIVWACSGSDVDTSIIDGKIVMKGRRVLTMNEKQIVAEVENRKQKILEQAEVTAQHIWPVL